MTGSLALQLYTLREALAQDYEETICQVAAMGYQAVETAGFPGTTPAAARQLFDSLGLEICSAHVGLPLGEQQNQVLDEMAVLGCRYMVCAWLDPQRYYQSLDGVKAACELLNQADKITHRAGYHFAYHNHAFELAQIAGKPALYHMLDYLNDTVMFEIDMYWVKVGGLDPVELLHKLGHRVPLLHVKDGPAQDESANMTAVGDGTLDIPAILGASQAEWHIVELDRCDTDIWEAVRKSHHYLQRVE